MAKITGVVDKYFFGSHAGIKSARSIGGCDRAHGRRGHAGKRGTKIGPPAMERYATETSAEKVK